MGYFKVGPLEVPEPGNSPTITGDLKKLAEGIVASYTPVGAWTALTLGAKIEEGKLGQSTRARTEVAGNRVFLRGEPKVKNGEELVSGETLAVLPIGLRPPELVITSAVALSSGNVPVALEISSAGIIKVLVNLKSKEAVWLDGVSFNLT